MELIYLRTFVKSVETGSFSKAAEILCVTQSAVSRRIKFLEDQYDYPLLDRSGPVLVPTEAGNIVLSNARKLLEIEDELLSGLKGIGEKQGVTFCCTPGFGTAFLPGVMRELLQTSSEMHNMQFYLGPPEQVLAGVQDGRYDIGLLEHCEQPDFTGLTTISLPDDEVLFISAPTLEIPSGVVSIDLFRRISLFSRREECCSTKFLTFNLSKNGYDNKLFATQIVYDDLHQIIGSVLDGLGIAFTSKTLVTEQLAAGTLRCHTVSGFTHHRRRTIISRSTNNQSHLSELLVREIMNCFK